MKKMKLKEGFVIHELDGEYMMVAVGDVTFAGLVHSDKTAAFIINQLKTRVFQG